MKISVITISYNQAEYLSANLESVASQEGPWEHIIVDPGSTDGSREYIKKCSNHFSTIVFEKDRGPADGLNRGFKEATGDIYYYLNSDDVVLPGTFAEVRCLFSELQNIDVLTAHGYVLDSDGKQKRRVWSDNLSRRSLAFGGCISIQPATFIRRDAFERTSGFNLSNQSNWDGELIVDLFLAGAKFHTVDRYWGGYRVYAESITGSGSMKDKIQEWSDRRYQKVMARTTRPWYTLGLRYYYRFRRLIVRPSRILDRINGGSVFGGG